MLSSEEKRARKKALDLKWRTENREKKRAQDAAYKVANADRLKQQNIEYYAKYGEKIRTYRSKHHAARKSDPAYRAKMLEVAAGWRESNPDKMAAHHADRAFKFQRATPAWADQNAIKIVYEKRDELSTRLGIQLQVDHVIPINSDHVCGLHVPANLQLLEKTLNGAKGNRFETDW